MTKKSLAEASADILSSNVSGKRAKGDGPKKLPGEVTNLGGQDEKTVTPDNTPNPDASVDVSKDKTAPAQTGGKAEGPRKLAGDPLKPTKIGEEEEINADEVLKEVEEAQAAELAEQEAAEAEAAQALAEQEAADEAAKQAIIDEVDVTEDVAALVDGTELSEDFQKKAKIVLETAVKRKLTQIIEHLEAKYEARLEEHVEALAEAFDEKIEEHLNYAVEEWSKANQVAIESSLRTELTEDFLAGLKLLFEEHYIDIPDDKIDLVEEYAAQVAELETKLNEQIETNASLTMEITEAKKAEVVKELSEGLVATDAEKFSKLVAEVSEPSLEAFTEKVKTLRESYFKDTTFKPAVGKGLDGETVLTEEELKEQVKADEAAKNPHDPMNVFVAQLDRLKPGMPLGIKA